MHAADEPRLAKNEHLTVGDDDDAVVFPAALESTGTVVRTAGEASMLGGGGSSGMAAREADGDPGALHES